MFKIETDPLLPKGEIHFRYRDATVARIINMKFDSPDLTALLTEADEGVSRDIFRFHVRDIETRLQAAVCDILVERGRIMPGEVLLQMRDPYDLRGRFQQYRFPESKEFPG